MLYEFDGKRPLVGLDSYVSETAQVIGEVIIGKNCYIGHGAIVRGDYGRIEIGDGTAIEEGAILHAPPNNKNKIGCQVTIGHGAIIHGKVIEDYAVIGMGAITSIWSEVGSWAIVAEGSVVKLKDIIPPRVVVAGNPAVFKRAITSKDQDLWWGGKQVYIDLAKKYLEVGLLPLS